MYMTIYEIDASSGSVHETGSSGLVHWDVSKEWDGDGGGRWGSG